MCREVITALQARHSIQQVMLASTVYELTRSLPFNVNNQTSVPPTGSTFSRPTSRTQLS